MAGRWSQGAATAVRSRRELLRLGLGVALGSVGVPALGRATSPSDRRVTLYAIHTGEAVSVEYVVGGRYCPDALEAVSRVLRDHRTGKIHPVDPGVLDVLHEVAALVDSRAAFHVVCGFRSATTNEWKWRHGGGVARNSLHRYGRAVDVFLPGCELDGLRRAALRLGAGGVGYYPRSGFVHLDTGPVRSW